MGDKELKKLVHADALKMKAKEKEVRKLKKQLDLAERGGRYQEGAWKGEMKRAPSSKRTRNKEAELKRQLHDVTSSFEDRLARKDARLRKALSDLDTATSDLNTSFEDRRLEMSRAEDVRRDLERKLE